MKGILKIIILSVIPLCSLAQQTPVTDQYVLNPLSINPAFAGSRGALNIAAFYRRQWIGIQGSPETVTFSVDAPFNDEKIGLGFTVFSDKIGVTKENQFKAIYSYKIKMGKGSLSLGMSAGATLTNTAYSNLVVIDPGDETYLADTRTYIVPDFGFGLQYSVANYFAAFSIPALLSYSFDFSKNKYRLNNDPGNYNYMLNTGYVFKLGSNLKFFPSLLLRYSESNKLQYDLNTHFAISDRFWLGTSYRNNRSVGFFFQVQPLSQIRIGYIYDFDISKMGNYTNGSHELMLRFEFRYKMKIISPLIF